MGIEDPDIEKGISLAFVPKVWCSDIYSSTVLRIGAALMESLSAERLQCRLNAHVRAHLSK